MKRTELLQELRIMKFSELYNRTQRRELSQAEVAGILGMSERTFRRYARSFDEEGEEGLCDRRLCRVAGNRTPTDTVINIMNLFDTRYWDFTPKHFHEKLVSDHGFGGSYNWVRLTLQKHGRVLKAPRRGRHRRKRERRSLPGMMLHQDASSHEWVIGQWWDLIVTMDDANSEIYSAIFANEEGTMSTFQSLLEAIETKGLFCSLYTDRGSYYWHTPEAGGKVDKTNPTQVGKALSALGVEMIAAYSPEARGRSERMFGTLQGRLPQELRLRGITTMEEANRFLREEYIPDHNAKFVVTPVDQGTAFVPFVGDLENSLCIKEERVVGNDNTVRYKNRVLQIPADQHRNHYVKTRVRVHEYPDGRLAVFYGPRCLAQYHEKAAIDKEKKEQVA